MADRVVGDFRSSFDAREPPQEPPHEPTLLEDARHWLAFRLRRTSWWVKVLVIFAASRAVTTVIMLAYANIQAANPWTGAKPDYFSFAAMWDSYWYYIVAVSGYPSTLPLGSDGHVAENAWAFLPGFPAVLRIFLTVGIPYQVAGVIIAVAFSAGSALLLYRLLARVLPAGTALFAVVLFCTGATSPILQVGYAESMQLFFLFLALLLLQDRRYYLMIPVIAAAALTRPTGLAFAVLLLFHAIHRFVTRHRDAFPTRQRVAVVVVGLSSAFLGAAWPLVAWIGTGSSSAYTDTELAWRTGWIGYQELVPFQPWFQGAQWWLNWLRIPNPWPWAVIGMILLIAAFTVALFTPAARRLGVDLRFWIAGYAVYLLAVFFPQTSTFRLLMPLAPALGAVAIPRSIVYRMSLVVFGIVGQVVWMYFCWWVNGSDWSPP
jgi:Gpi18-like mannosyltransferase